MKKKPRFNPEITRVKLNPEQAVLQCTCWTGGFLENPGGRDRGSKTVCYAGGSRDTYSSLKWSGSTGAT